MADRSHEGPMDFEYTDGTGPMDARSPFAQLSMNQQRSISGGLGANGKKRGLFAAFQSPSKSSYPALREPNSQAHLFSQPPTPFSTARASHFATPRKLDLDLASSGGETPQSPEHMQVDSDATPDNSMSALNFRGTAAKFDQDTMPTFTAGPTAPQPSPSKKSSRRDSWLVRAQEFFSNSPGRGDVVRSRDTAGTSGVYSDKLAKRVRKKRAREAGRLAKLRDGSVSDSETNDDRQLSQRKTSRSKRASDQEDDSQPKGYGHYVSSFFEFLALHPTLPTILSWYAQLTLNVFLFTGIMYVIWSFWATIRSDVDKRSSEAIAELMAEMAICATQYTNNKCERSTRVPAMEVVCDNWEKCMSRDPKSVGRARVSAHTFAEIFNSFLEPISYKAMVFTLFLVFGCVALSNLPFSMFRDRAAQAAAASSQQQAAQNHHHYYPPPTPSRQLSGQMMEGWNPMLTHPRSAQETIEPAPGEEYYGHIEGRGSPVKALQFR